MVKFKFDAKQLQKMLVEKAEYVGLGVAGLLLVLCFMAAVMALLWGAKSPAKDIDKNVTALKGKIASSSPKVEDKPVQSFTEWSHPKLFRDLSEKYAGGQWFDGSGTASNKRERPTLLAMDKQTQLWYVLGGTHVYEVDQEGKVLTAFKGPEKKEQPKVEGKDVVWNGEPVQQLRPTRMIVVSGTFPYKDQVAEYQKALRVPSVEDLFKKELQPMFRGFNVLRAQAGPGQSLQDAKWEPLYTCVPVKVEVKDDKGNVVKDDKGNPKTITDNRVEAAKHIRDFLAEAVLDENIITSVGQYLAPNASTPLPELGTGRYPPLKLPGINPLKIAKPDPLGKQRPDKGPKGGGVVGKTFKKENKVNPGAGNKPMEDRVETEKVKFAELPKDMADKFLGQFNVVSQTGVFELVPIAMKDDDTKVNQPGTKTLRPPGKEGGVGKKDATDELPNGYAFTKIPDKGRALIRFIDVDVQPGFTYQYKIQLVFANPNYLQENEVTHAEVAAPSVLVDAERFLTTESITIPDEYRFYIFDQESPEQDGRFDQKKLTTQLRKAESIDTKALPNDRVAIQIFQWVGKTTDVANTTFTIADWAVLERLLVGRGGDKIGRKDVEVEVPVWEAKKNDFEIGEGFVDPKRAAKLPPPPAGVRKAGVPIDFLQRQAPGDVQDVAPVVVDFDGGRGGGRQYRGDLYDDKSNSPLEVLLLGPDGKMRVLNSRDDSDDRNPTSETGRRTAERSSNYATSRARLNGVRQRQFPPADKKEPGK